MIATKFEFEHRLWIIALIFVTGFALSALDRTNLAVDVSRLTAGGASDHTQSLITRGVVLAGAAFVFAAAFVRTWASAYLHTAVVHDPRQHTEALIVDGPYRHVRNPLYLANLPLAAGIGVLTSRIGWAFMVIAMWAFIERLISREEQGLLATQGEAVRAYYAAVPRLWPSLCPRIRTGRAQPRWRQAVAGEIFTWMFGLALVVFAAALKFGPSVILMAAGFLSYFVSVTAAKARSSHRRP